MNTRQNKPQDQPAKREDKQLDEALQETFPASDPIAVHKPEAGTPAGPKANSGRNLPAASGPDQSLQAGSHRQGESAGSGGEGRRPVP